MVYENVCMISTMPTKRISAISQWKKICRSSTHKMAAKASWHRHYVTVTLCIELLKLVIGKVGWIPWVWVVTEHCLAYALGSWNLAGIMHFSGGTKVRCAMVFTLNFIFVVVLWTTLLLIWRCEQYLIHWQKTFIVQYRTAHQPCNKRRRKPSLITINV